MPEVTIGGKSFQVNHLEGAAWHRYINYIGGIARDTLNPWLELYQQVQMLPANLQEIAFWRLYHEPMHAISELEFYRIGSQVAAVKLLVVLMIPNFDPAEVIEQNAADIFAELYPHIEKGQEQTVSGPAAMGILRDQVERERKREAPPPEPHNAD